jgi:oxygen-independent coproporphyrinogen-3 oxidase
VRWWNVKHPTAYAARLAAGTSPAYAREVLDEETRRIERVLLEIRLREGLPLAVLPDRARAQPVVADGLAVLEDDHLVLTVRGRLLADAVVRTLLP